MKYSTSIPDACGRAFMRFHVMQYHPHQIIASVYAGSVRPQLWMQGRDDEKNGSDLKRRGTMRVADRVAHVLPTCMRAHLLTHAPRIHSSVSLDMHAPCRHHAPRILSFCVAVTGLGGIMKNARRGDGRYRMIHVWAVGRRVQSCAYVCVVRLMPYSASRQCIKSCTIYACMCRDASSCFQHYCLCTSVPGKTCTGTVCSFPCKGAWFLSRAVLVCPALFATLQ